MLDNVLTESFFATIKGTLTDLRPWPPGQQLGAGESWQDSDLVFCGTDGTGLDRWQVRREFAAITKAARLGGNGPRGSCGTRSCRS